MLLRMRQEADLSKSSVTPLAELEPQTDMLILLDRSVDPLTPLLCQLSYEGLISEKWGIQYGKFSHLYQTELILLDLYGRKGYWCYVSIKPVFKSHRIIFAV